MSQTVDLLPDGAEEFVERMPPELQRPIINLLNKHARSNGPEALIKQAIGWRNEIREALAEHLSENVAERIDSEISAAVDKKLADRGENDTEDGWKVYTLADAYAPREPLRWLVDRLILAGSLIIPYGMPGGFKSMILADMCVCVAAGVPWLEPLPGQEGSARQTSQCPVIWFDFDNGKRRTLERFGALGRARGLPADTPVYSVSMPTPWLDAGDPVSMAHMRRKILGADAGLAVVDNLGVIRGKAEENGADMAMVMSNFRQLTEETGCTVMPIHHQRKSNGVVTRAGESLRGHSSIEASADLALLIEREPASPMATLKSTKSRDMDVEPFGAIFTYDHDEHGEMYKARFWAQPIEDNESPQAVRDAILDALTDGEPNQTQIVTSVQEMLEGIGRHKILGELTLMESANKIRSVAGPRNSKRYFSV